MAWFNRSRPRGTRPELPTAVPGTQLFPGSGQWGEIPLPLPSTTTVLGLPAASRAVYMISNAVAQMAPMEAWGPDGFATDNPPTILTRPNTTYGTFDFFQMACALAIVRGNFLGIQADFDAQGYPQQVVPVPAGFWLAYYDKAGYLVYSIGGDIYSRDQVVHVRANAMPNQPMGVGVVTQFRRSIGQALDQQNFAADTYRSGSVPAGVIELDLPEVDGTQATDVQAQWLTGHSGGRAPAVLPNTMKFVPIAFSPEDMQFLQARHFTVGEIAHMFNLDPSDLGAALTGSSMTYANIEQRQQQRIVDSYAPWMRRFEEEWTDLLPGKIKAKLVPANLLLTDSKTRAEVTQLNVGTGVETVDEARESYGRKPLPASNPLSPNYKPPAPPAPAPGQAPAGGAPAPGSPAGAPPPGPVQIPGTDLESTPVKVKK